MPEPQKARLLRAVEAALQSRSTSLYTRDELVQVLNANVPLDLSGKYKSIGTLIQALKEIRAFRIVKLFAAHPNGTHALEPRFVRYSYGRITRFEIGSALRPGSYLSHSTAAYIHRLCTISQATYVNKEQRPKRRSSGPLVQANIDRAFGNKPRVTTHVFTDGSHTYFLLNGKGTNDTGVEEVRHRNVRLRVTDIPRTLVDLVVRPQYAGGASGVLAAIRRAKGRVSVRDLVSTLSALDHVYPYHQALGFYLDLAGFPEAETAQLLELGLRYEFYLEHRASQTHFNAKWRVNAPLDLG